MQQYVTKIKEKKNLELTLPGYLCSRILKKIRKI